MQAPFSLFLALRYLKPKRTFVSVITLISVAGVALGVTTLILVISVMTGFDHELRKKVLGFDAHILLSPEGVMYNWRELEAQVKDVPHVLNTAPFMQGPVIVEFAGRRLAPNIRGIDVKQQQQVTDMAGAIKYGSLDLEMDAEGNSNKAVIGIEMAKELHVHVGDKITVFSPGNLSDTLDAIDHAKKDKDNQKLDELLEDLQQTVAGEDLTVTGIFESGRFVYDSEFILVPLNIGQELYGLGDGVHGISIRTDDPYRVYEVKENLEKVIEPGTEVRTWIDLNKELFDAIHMERNTMLIILFIIVIVAAFGITNTLITVTVQKTREIGIMKALGATPSQIVWVFMMQGMVVGVFGTALGLATGMILVRWRNEFKDLLASALHIEVFPASVYQFSAIPAEVTPSIVVVICIGAFVICSLAALIPAYVAARLDPVKALRYE